MLKKRKSPCILAFIQALLAITFLVLLDVEFQNGAWIELVICCCYGILSIIFGLISLKFRIGGILLLILSAITNLIIIVSGIFDIADILYRDFKLFYEFLCCGVGTILGIIGGAIGCTDRGIEEKSVAAQSKASEQAVVPTERDEAPIVTHGDASTAGKPRTISDFNLSFADTIVSSSDWKAFRRGASDDELAALAIGSRYRLYGAGFFVKAIVSVVGMILSVIIGVSCVGSFGWFSIFLLVGGYLFFNLLASKLTGYADTYSSCYRKLSENSRRLIKNLFPENAALTVLRTIVVMALNIITIPYKFILLIIEVLIPPARNWCVAHGGNEGAVITIPKGYDIGNLAALGQYYASATFSQAWEEHLDNVEREKLAKFSTYEYTDKNGMRQVAYSDDGKTFYDSTNKLHEVGTSTDGGKTIDLK